MARSSLLIPACIAILSPFWSWSGLCSAADNPPPSSEATEVSARFVEQFQSLLDLGLKPDIKNADQAAVLYKSLLVERRDDPRVEFAYYLVLQQLFRPGEAQEHLDKSDGSGQLFLPGREARIRTLIRERKFSDAADLISQTMRSLKSDDQELAGWIGRIVACVAGPVGSADTKRQFQLLDHRLRGNQSPVILAAYERGFAELELEVDDLRASIDLVENDLHTKSAEIKQAMQMTDSQRRAQLQATRDELKKAGKKWDDWLADETLKYDEELKEMEKRYFELEQSASVMTQNIATLRIQLERLAAVQQGTNSTPTAISYTSGVPTLGTAIGMVDMQIESQMQRLAIVYSGQQEISRRASILLSQRKAIAQEYQAATGKVAQQAEALKKWDQRAKKQAEDAKKNADKKPASLASLEARIRSLSTYDPYRFDIARARLLSEYTVAPQTSKE